MASGVVSFRALPPWARHIRALAVALTTSPWIILNIMRFLPVWAMGTVLGLYGVVALQLLVPQRVEVGADGVMIRWLGRGRFIPFARIRDVRGTALGVDLGVDADEWIEIRLTQRDNGARSEVARLLNCIEDARTAVAHHDRSEIEAFLARGERDVDAWLRDMRALGEADGAGYRSVAIPRERLWELAENPSADPSAREGAALALFATLDDEGRARLSAIAGATAAPRLRIVLTRVASEKAPERLRVAFEDLEREELVTEAEAASEERRRRFD